MPRIGTKEEAANERHGLHTGVDMSQVQGEMPCYDGQKLGTLLQKLHQGIEVAEELGTRWMSALCLLGELFQGRSKCLQHFPVGLVDRPHQVVRLDVGCSLPNWVHLERTEFMVGICSASFPPSSTQTEAISIQMYKNANKLPLHD